MALSEERTIFYIRTIKVDQNFLNRSHPEEFYTKVIDFPAGFKRTNEEHIKCVMKDRQKELSFKDYSLYWLKFRFNTNYHSCGNTDMENLSRVLDD